MNMQIDRYTGQPYDADKCHRDENGMWVDVEDEKRFKERQANYVSKRRDKRNANRVARGKRRKSPAEFDRSARRYDAYLREDSGLRFGEWLRLQKQRSRYGCAF